MITLRHNGMSDVFSFTADEDYRWLVEYHLRHGLYFELLYRPTPHNNSCMIDLVSAVLTSYRLNGSMRESLRESFDDTDKAAVREMLRLVNSKK